MNKTLNLAGAFLALALGSSALAVPITGAIGFVGDYTPNNQNLQLATSISFGAITTDGSSTGSFAGIANGTAVTVFSPLLVNQGPVGNTANTGTVLPGSAIWTVGGFSLTLSSLIEQFNSANSLNLYGVGTLTGPAGSDPTPGEWVATFNRSGGGTNVNFTFSASSSAIGAVPEGGATAALLGLSMLSLGFMRRFFARA